MTNDATVQEMYISYWSYCHCGGGLWRTKMQQVRKCTLVTDQTANVGVAFEQPTQPVLLCPFQMEKYAPSIQGPAWSPACISLAGQANQLMVVPQLCTSESLRCIGILSAFVMTNDRDPNAPHEAQIKSSVMNLNTSYSQKQSHVSLTASRSRFR